MPVSAEDCRGTCRLPALLIGLAGFSSLFARSSGRSCSNTARPITTATARYSPPVACKPESEILAAIGQVHAKYDHLEGVELAAFEQRAALLKGLPPLNIEKLYVITEDDQLRDGEMVLFIGLRVRLRDDGVRPADEAIPRDSLGEARERVSAPGACLPRTECGCHAKSDPIGPLWTRVAASMPLSVSPGLDHPTLPEGQLLYAVGDIHGRLDLLRRPAGADRGSMRRQAGMPSGARSSFSAIMSIAAPIAGAWSSG